MRKFLLLSIISIISFTAFGQDFSNKGKDFWVGYGYHQIMQNGNSQDMVLYFATDQVSNVTVSIPLLGYSVTYPNIGANTVFQTPALPKGGISDSRLFTEGLSDKGIHITSDVPIVAYAHIYNASVSGATVLYPVNTLGKDYYSVNFTNNSNIANANCWFYVVAVDTGTTVVSITPSANTIGGWAAGSKNTVTLTQGQVYNVMGVTSGNNGVDLTGSIISSIASGTGGCKRIAVFSGSGRIAIACNGATPSSDNYMVQGLPKSAWGKRFLTTPSANYSSNSGVAPPMANIYRVCVTDPATVVTVDGLPIAVPLNGGFYYELPSSPNYRKIVADKPIMVAQYLPSQGNAGCGIPGGDGDPEVIYLSPIEQSISTVRWDACSNFAINAQKHYINVVIPNGGTALSSVRLDGAPLPAGTFITHPQDPNYSTAIIRVGGSAGISVPHVIQSDSGFNAIAYGYGSAESYGYNAGTNVLDLYQHVGIFTQYGTEVNPIICTGTSFKFKVSLPYVVDSIRWNLTNLPAATLPNNNTMVTHYECPPVTYPCYDSSTLVNFIPVYWYSLPANYTVPVVGSYNLSLTTYFPTAECGNSQDVPFTLQVVDPPVASFTFTTPACYLEPAQFSETTPQVPKPTYKWNWDFGDPASGPLNNVSILKSPTHTFSGPGTYTVQFSSITTAGCISNIVTQQITVPDVPNGSISGAANVCINDPSPTVTLTATGGLAPYTMNYSINGVGQAPVTSNGAGIFTITGIPTNVPGTFVYSLDSIKNFASTLCKKIITGQTATVTVTDNATLTLTSAAGTNSQTLCVNNAIINITYAVGGSGTGGSVTGLPAGVTGTYAAGVITITGTPTASGTFTYTVNTTGPCIKPSLTGTLTVNGDATVALTSAVGSDNQTACINTPIVTITYAIGGGGTGGTVTGLPAGVTGTYAGGVLTIVGTPSVAGTFNYTVNTAGPCVKPTATGSITVTADATLTLTSAAGTNTQTLCINTAITNITYAVGGTGTGGAVAGLPAGVTGTYAAGVITITGTPTVSGTFPYTVNTTGPCAKPSLTGTLTVTADGTLSLSSAPGSNIQTVCINTPIVNIQYAAGGSLTGATVAGLPAGVTGTYAGGTVTIVGSPTVAGTFNYTINTTGPCVKPTATGTITVTGDATLTLTSAAGTNSQTLCVNNAITNITYAVAGTGTGGSVSGLPTGVTGTYAGGVITITGTPTVSGTFTYTVNTTGPCAKPALTGTLTVNADATLNLTSAVGTNIQAVCVNTPIVLISYSIGGGGTGATVTGLPTGVNGTYAGGVLTITGSPSVTGTFNYTVNTAGPCIKPTATGSITVNADATLTLTSAAGTNTQVLCVNNAITNITYAVGGSGTGGSVTGLPAGVTGTYSAGVITITGTPTASGTFTYTVNTTGPCAKPALTGSITVNADATLALTSAAGSNIQTVCINTPVTIITYSIGGGGTGGNVTGLPAGVTGTYAAGTLTILGSPTVAGTFNFTVNTTGPCVKPSATGSITVTADATLTLTSAAGTNSQTLCVNNAITNITYAVAGTGTGGSVAGLPAGVTGTYAGGVITITGTPTVSGTFTYTVNTTGPCAKPTATGTLTVNADATLTLSSAAGTNGQTVCVSSTITNITYTVGGGGTGGSVTGLPAGVTGTYSGGTITITGTPTVSGTFTYTVNTTGPCVKPSTTGTITVNPLPTALIAGTLEVCQNAASVPVTFTGANGTAPYTFTYSVNGGADQTVTTTVGNSVAVLQATTTATTYTYVLKSVKDGTSTGCNQLQNGTVTVKVNPLPTATISGTKLICINTTAPDITFTGAGGSTPYTFRYRIDNGTGPGPLSSVTTTGTNTSVTVLVPTITAGTFTYTLEDVTDGSTTACLQAQSGSATVTISDVFPVPAFIFSDPVCLPNALVQFQNQTTISNNTPMTYLWNFGDGSNPSTALQPSHTYSSTGPFSATLQATSDAGCVRTYSTPINTIHAQPKAEFSISNPGGVCIGDDVVLRDLTDAKDGVVTTWKWDLGDGTRLTTNPVTYRYGSATTYTITYYTINSFGCNSDTITKSFTVHPYPLVDAGPDRVVLEGGSVTMQPNVTGNDLQYLWSPATYLNSTTDAAPTANLILNDITYTLTVTGRGGCVGIPDKMFVKVLKAPRIPNTFTPNGDGMNELWLIDYLDTYPNNRVQVFTRTGQLVFESRGYRKPWDGKLNGKPLPFDTYYYIIEPGNGRAPMTGYVTIVK